MISESGLQNPESLRHLQALGFRGFLMGEALMRARDPEAALRDLIAAKVRGDIPEQQSTPMTNNAKTVGRLCQTPWRFTETPYNVEPALMKGRGDIVPPALTAFTTEERRSRSDTPYQTPARL